MRVPVFVRSEYSNALVGGGFPQSVSRSANLDSAFGGMQLFATEAWRAASLLLTRSAQLAQPTVRLPPAVTAMGSPSLALSHLCSAACVSDTARRLPAHCETMGVRSNHATSAWSHLGPEVRSIYSVDDKTCLLAGAEQEGLAHSPWGQLRGSFPFITTQLTLQSTIAIKAYPHKTSEI